MDEKYKGIEKYGKYYSDSSLKQKVLKVAKKAGSRVINPALLLYYVLKSKKVSFADKAKICGALGYFILPLDIIPDFIPLAGYGDDLATLAWAIHTVYENVTPEMKEQAQKQLDEWFDNK